MKKRVTPPGEPVPDKPLWQSNVPLPDVSGVRAWPGLALLLCICCIISCISCVARCRCQGLLAAT